jgi:hypothetical protein
VSWTEAPLKAQGKEAVRDKKGRKERRYRRRISAHFPL